VSTSSSSSSSGGTALTSKQKLANYLASLTNKSGKHLLLGQHSDYWTDAPMANITAITNATGKYPSILGTTLDLGNSPEDGVTTSNQWLAKGGIVMLSWWAGNPHTGVNSGDADNASGNFNDVLTPGTTAYKNFYATLDILAGQLKQINGPVMFRPFLELNGNWFWWGGHDTASFIKLWKATHDYLVNTKGVTNLLWVYCINAGLGKYADYYPGSDYVDVVAMDAYPIRSSDGDMIDPLSKLNKPIIYAEADQGAEQVQGTLPYVDTVDDNVMVTTVLNNFPNVVGIVTWCNTTSLEKQLNINEAMNNSQVITRSDLPTDLY
jgi:mannan endo-1,4-beta-mannosidase